MDRTLWARFGEATLQARPMPCNGSATTALSTPATATVLYGHELGLVPITTPAYSPESNGLAEAFVGTFKRDYVAGAEQLRDAETVLAQLGGWFEATTPRRPTQRSRCGARLTTGQSGLSSSR